MSQISPLKHANEQYIFVPDPNSVAESQEKQSDFHQTQGRNNEPTDIYLHGLDLAILVVIFMMGSFAISLDATIISMFYSPPDPLAETSFVLKQLRFQGLLQSFRA